MHGAAQAEGSWVHPARGVRSKTTAVQGQGLLFWGVEQTRLESAGKNKHPSFRINLGSGCGLESPKQ